MSSVKQKALATFLLLAFGALVPLQTVSAQIAICNSNDLSNWVYTPGTPTEDIGNPPSTFVNKITGEVQKTDWIYKANTDADGMPTGSGYWTTQPTSADEVPPTFTSSDPVHPPVTQADFTYRTLGFVDLSENRNEQILRQNRETGILELSGPWPFRDQWTVVDWTEEEVQRALGNTAYNNYLLYQQGMVGGDVIGDIFDIAAAVLPSLIIGGFTAGIGATLGIPTMFNVAIPQELAVAIKDFPFIGDLVSIGCYDPTGACTDLATGVTQEIRGVANNSGFNTFADDYSGSFIQINPLSVSLVGYGVGSDNNWTFELGSDAVTCTAPIAVTPVIETTPTPVDTPPDTTPTCPATGTATGADTQVYSMKITGGVYAASDIRDFAANMGNAMTNAGVNSATPTSYAYNAMATPFTYGGVSGETATCPQLGGCGFYQLPATSGAYFTLDGTKIGSNITVKHGWDATIFFGLCKPWDALSVDENLNYTYDCDTYTASGQASDWRGATKTLALWVPAGIADLAADSSACSSPTQLTEPVPPPTSCPTGQTLVNGVCIAPPLTCPADLVLMDDECVPSPRCLPPKIIINGVCTTPEVSCVPPKVLKNGVCSDPPPTSCPEPTTQEVTVACDLNAAGQAAISGSVIRRQTKSAYPACVFPKPPVTVDNSVYVSDTCVYPPPALTVACFGAPANPYVGQPVTWSSSVSGNSDWYIYEWSGTDDLYDTIPTTRKFYSTIGRKEASLTVTDPKTGQSASAVCLNGANVRSVTVRSCTASLTANPSTIEQGQTTTLSWAVSDGALCASSCSGGSGFDTGGAIAGSAEPTVLPSPPGTSYTLTCTAGTYGPPPPVNALVTVIVPDVNITVNGQTTPPRVDMPGSVTVAWTPVNPSVADCAITRNGEPWRTGTSGSIIDSVTAPTTYEADCWNDEGVHLKKSIKVNSTIFYREY